MYNNKFCKYFCSITLIVLLFSLTVTAQVSPSCPIYVPQSGGGNTTYYFTVSQGSCNAGQSINVVGINPNPNQTWVVNGTAYTGQTQCIPVSTPNSTYFVSYTAIVDVNGKPQNVYATCSIYIGNPSYNPITFQSGKPEDPIKQKIDMDKHVGTIKGTNSVSLTGSATYDIAVALPKGNMGIEPSLAIAYSSHGGNGLLGYGWNIGIGSSITRVQRDHYHDGLVSAPNLYSSDAFALDGNRLVLNTGNYGDDGSTYLTKNESFSRVTLKKTGANGDFYFIVETKDGKTLEYGATTDARLGNGKNSVLWNINKVYDQYGNYLVYEYQNINNSIRLQRVLYTGNEKAKIKPYNSIDFEYANRKDANIGYITGVPIYDKYLITAISIKSDGSQFRRYEFGYVEDGIHAFLREMKVAGKDNLFLNSTYFQYGNPTSEFNQVPTAGLPNIVNEILSSGDFNGDGLTDILVGEKSAPKSSIYKSFHVKTKNGNTSSFITQSSVMLPTDNEIVYETGNGTREQLNFMAQDFNGDSFDDVPIINVKREYIDNNDNENPALTSFKYLSSVDIYHSTGTGIFNAPLKYLPNASYKYIYYAGNIVNKSKNYFINGDFDGDSKSDYITILSSATDIKAFVNFPNNNSLNNEIFGSYGSTSLAYFANEWAKADFLSSIDFDGDGKSDIFYLKYNEKTQSNEIRIYTIGKDNAGNYTTQMNHSEFISQPIVDIDFGDFNGDRKTDLLLELIDNSFKKYYETKYSTGINFNSSVNLTYFNTDETQKVVSDFNGDGLADVCFMLNKLYEIHTEDSSDPTNVSVQSVGSSNEFDIYFSNGVGFIKKFFSNQFIPPANAVYVVDVKNDFVGDFNGDGKSDFCSYLNFTYFSPNSTNHLLERVVDGYGREVSFSYAKATDGGIFTRGSAANNAQNFPFNNVQLPMFLAASTTAPDGVGGTSSTNYRYENAQVYRMGLGFLGFDRVIADNNTTQMRTISDFGTINLITPYKGVTTYLKNSTTIRAGRKLSEITNDYKLIDRGNGRWWLRLDGSTQVDELRGQNTTQTNYIYDPYGNIKEETTDIVGVETAKLTAAYEQYGSWIPSSPTVSITEVNRKGAAPYSKTISRKYNPQGSIRETDEFGGLVVTRYAINPMVGVPDEIVIDAANAQQRKNTLTYTPNYRFLETSTNILGQVTTTKYDPTWGSLASITGVDGLTTSYGFDELGREVSVSPPGGYTINTSYRWSSSQGNPFLFEKHVEHPLKPDSREYFDILERSMMTEVDVYGGKKATTHKRFDHLGRVITSTSPTGVTSTFKYSNLDVLEESIVSGIGTTKIKTTFGKITTVETILPSKRFTISKTDATGKMISKEDEGGVIAYEYNSQGLPVKVTSGGVVVSETSYDVQGNTIGTFEPNFGGSSFEYDGLGQLLRAETPKNETTYKYNEVGSLRTRLGKEGLTSYTYYQKGAAINKVQKVENFNGYTEEYAYDQLGRIVSQIEEVEGRAFSHGYTYDNIGNLLQEVFPSGYAIDRTYNTDSYLETVKDANTGTVIFKTNEVDLHGNYSNYLLGNGLKANTSYDMYGYPQSFKAGNFSEYYEFDIIKGNLDNRTNMQGITETFDYDNMDRLETFAIGGIKTSMSYANNGNMMSKSDFGTDLKYDKERVNALISAKNAVANYYSVSQHIQYTPFLRPDEICISQYLLKPANKNNFMSPLAKSRGNEEYCYGVCAYLTYGSDFERRMMEISTNDYSGINKVCEGEGVSKRLVHSRIFYQGHYEHKETMDIENTDWHGVGYANAPSKISEMHYIAGGDGLCAIMVRTYKEFSGETTDSLFYVHKDYLGSLLAFSDEKGKIIYEQNFDPWGRKRNSKDGAYVNYQGMPEWAIRGFTGHEHLHDGRISFVDLINMNARLYDPVMGQMLSPDIALGSDDTQGHNRYSYALNNPLKYTDPTGNFVTWSLSYSGFSIGLNFTPIGIPLGFGINVGFGYGNGTSFGVYGEVGYRFGGTGFGAGATLNAGISYNFQQNNWTASTSASAYKSIGMFNVGANFGFNYDLSSRQLSKSWGLSVGIGIGGDGVTNGVGLSLSYGSGGWGAGIGGYYNNKPKPAEMQPKTEQTDRGNRGGGQSYTEIDESIKSNYESLRDIEPPTCHEKLFACQQLAFSEFVGDGVEKIILLGGGGAAVCATYGGVLFSVPTLGAGAPIGVTSGAVIGGIGGGAIGFGLAYWTYSNKVAICNLNYLECLYPTKK
jgi:RHS repeat-associated protein